MLSKIQLDVAKLIAGVEGRKEFALAGGAALILQKISDRTTKDLDFFTREKSLVNSFAENCINELENNHFDISIETENDGFVSFKAKHGVEETNVDIGELLDQAPNIDPGFTIDRFLIGLGALNRFDAEQSGFTEEEWFRVLAWSNLLAEQLPGGQ